MSWYLHEDRLEEHTLVRSLSLEFLISRHGAVSGMAKRGCSDLRPKSSGPSESVEVTKAPFPKE